MNPDDQLNHQKKAYALADEWVRISSTWASQERIKAAEAVPIELWETIARNAGIGPPSEQTITLVLKRLRVHVEVEIPLEAPASVLDRL